MRLNQSVVRIFVVFLLSLGLVPSSQAFSLLHFHNSTKMSGDGVLTLNNLHLGEKISVQYRNANGTYNKAALALIDKTLRCRQTQKVHDMPVKLIELVDAIQDHFGAKEVDVVSGYRSPEFNESLFESGHHVARNSMHTLGYAMDIRLPGVGTQELRNYAASLKKGGVGFYPHNQFVHVDVGRVRYWADGPVDNSGSRVRVAMRHKGRSRHMIGQIAKYGAPKS